MGAGKRRKLHPLRRSVEPTPMAAVEASPTHTKIPINTPIPTETMTTTSTRAPATAPTRRLTRNELVATRALLQTERSGATATPVFVNTPIAQPIAAPGLPEQPEPTAAPPLVEVEPTSPRHRQLLKRRRGVSISILPPLRSCRGSFTLGQSGHGKSSTCGPGR